MTLRPTGPVAEVPPSTRSRLLAVARLRAPLETGGVLLGVRRSPHNWTVTGFVEVPSLRPDRRRYEADPRAVRDWVDRPVVRGRRVVGMFHTHPEGPATPSPLDSRSAAAGLLHAIVGRGREIRAFWRGDPGRPLTEVALSGPGFPVGSDP